MNIVQKAGNGLQSKALHTQILQEIRELILSGGLAAGDRLPSELQIAEQHHTSRGTVRQALTALVNEGLLERVQGSGTFVRQSPMTQKRTPGNAMSAAPVLRKSIGVILSDYSDELNMDILRGVEQVAKPRGYQLSFAYAEENPGVMALDIARLRANTDGLIVFPISNISYDATLAQLQQENYPFVLVDRYLSDLDTDYVTSDNLGGGYRATEHLLILGHRRIGFVHSRIGNLSTSSVRERWEGYRKALQEYHQQYDEEQVYDLQVEKGQEPLARSFEDFITSSNRPSAVFAASGSVALELMLTAQRFGVRVPEDLALVSFDDLSYMPHLSVPLTSIAQQSTEMGLHAGMLLINRIEHQISGGTRHIELPTSLIVRQSCGARLRIASNPPMSAQPS